MTIPRPVDQAILNPVCGTVVWSLMFRIENVFGKKCKHPICETVIWPLADRVKNLIEKNNPVCQTVIWSLVG